MAALLGTDGEPSLILQGRDGRKMYLDAYGISFEDAAGKPRIILGMAAPEALATMKKRGLGSDPTPSLELYDKAGKPARSFR